MKNNFLPTEYHLEVCEGSLLNDPSLILQSSTPFGSMSVGDYFNAAATDQWANPPKTSSERFVIQEIEHIFWHVDKSHNGHKIMISLKKEAH